MNRPVVAALGVCHRDVELACLWLRWVTFLDRQEGGGRGHILVVYTKRVDPAPLREAARGAKMLNIVPCPDEDESGYPRSASHLFLRTLEGAEKLFPGHAVFWCEPDTTPMKPSWFAEIAAEYQTCGKPFLGMLVGTQHPHLSGNAIYPADWRTVAPSIANVLNAPDYKLWGPGKGQPWDVYCRGETTPQMAVTKLMFQVWKERDARATRLKDIPAGTCLFHQDKTGALIREIAAARYPEFMATLNEGRRFYVLNGHASRLRAKGVNVKFSYEKWAVGGWRSAVCSTEIPDESASALATLAGRFGLREVSEKEFLEVTGRAPRDLPTPRLKPAMPARVNEGAAHSHPSVFVMLGRYGDICNILPMLKAEADAGRRPTLVVSDRFADILDGVSYVDRIVWEGDYDRLPDALRWLHRDKGIRAPVVCQYHRNPYDKARLTDSYQKEVWRLAGRLDQFATRGPLVFDRRDTEREAQLVARFTTSKPLILVGLESVSSPLVKANAVLRALVDVFEPHYEVLNLSNVKAERVYDLIGLFDEAALLIAADTMHLHLARASKVPLLALLNDGWRGSTVEHARATFRYAEIEPAKVATDAAALISPLISVGELAQIIKKGSEIFAPKILHAVDVFGSDARHHVAQSTWSAAYLEGMTPVHVSAYSRDAKSELGDPRALPFLKDLLQVAIDASSHDDDVICWTNADIGLKPGVAALVGEHVRAHGAAAMRRTESNGKGHPGRDLFAFTVKWLRDHWTEMPDYVLGAPVFDLGLVAMIRKFHGLPFNLKSCNDDLTPADMPPGYALHQSHEPEWQVSNMDSVPSVRHNKTAFRAWAKRYAPEIEFSKGGNLK